MTAVVTSFKTFEAPRWLLPTVACLLATVPPGHAQSLSHVLLTDSDSIGRGKSARVRGRKWNRRDCCGFYHRATPRSPAHIVVIVDNVLRGLPGALRSIPFFREHALGRTLYHEVGHHLNLIVGSTSRPGEAAAESWSTRLLRQHWRSRHQISRAVFRVLGTVVLPIARLFGASQPSPHRTGTAG